MATVKQAIRENDFVELLRSAGEWPAGTSGTVVDEHGEHKLVEISDAEGQMLDLVSVPASQLRLISKHSA
ncbi:MAG: DUF4926 domain-containing protein [Solirubrobacteraceae bacterium]